MSFEQEEAVLRNTIYPGLENSPAAAMRLGVGVEPFCSAGFGYFCGVEKFRSLGVEKEGGVNVLGRLVISPLLSREREQLYFSGAKVTDAGEGSISEIHHLGMGFSDTLSLCSRYRFEPHSKAWQSIIPFPILRGRLKTLSPRGVNILDWPVFSPSSGWERGVMLNLFQHLTNIACDLQSCKILNSLKIEPEVKVRNYITKNDFLRFQDDNEHPSRPSCLPAGLQNSSLAPLGRGLGRGAKSFGLAGVTASFKSLRAQRSNPVDCRENQRFSRSDRGKYLDWSDISPLLSRERTQLYLSGAKVTDAGEGSISPKRRCA